MGLALPAWLTTGYRTALLSSNPDVHGLLETAPSLLGLPVLVNLPAFGIVMAITWLLLRGVARELDGQQRDGGREAPGAGAVRRRRPDGAARRPTTRRSRPNGFTGIHQGAAIVFFAYIGFDAISTAGEETRDPQRNLPIGILGGLAVCTRHLRDRRRRADRHGALQPSWPWPIRWRRRSSWRATRSVGWLVALGAAVSMTAVLLVFQYGQPRIFFAMARDGLLPAWAARVDARTRVPWATTLVTGIVVAVASLVGDAAETYDLTNIGTLFAFALVCAGVLVLRVIEPDRAAAVSRAGRLGGRAAGHRRLPVRDGRPAAAGLGAVRHLARPRHRLLRRLRLPAQPARAGAPDA